MKRVILFLATNIAIIATLSIVASLLGVNQYLTANGINYQSLLLFALVFGFGGAFISLALSKVIAKWTMGLQIIKGTESAQHAWLHSTIEKQARSAGISMPEVAIYNSADMNAFATGPTRNNALVAVSTGLLNGMNKDEVEAVLGHEVSHIANGDMVTMTLLQGVLNTFVIFAARVVGYFIDSFFRSSDSDRPGIGYMITSFVLEIVFGILASLIVAAYSRHREFRADAGGASLTSKASMKNALLRLGGKSEGQLAGGLNAFGINGKTTSWLSLFSTHPPIEQRVAALS